jgi:MbtH protein
MASSGPAAWRVVINDEEQYAFFPERLELPVGWREAGFVGTEAECTAFVDIRWTDMRPRSLREASVQSG